MDSQPVDTQQPPSAQQPVAAEPSEVVKAPQEEAKPSGTKQGRYELGRFVAAGEEAPKDQIKPEEAQEEKPADPSATDQPKDPATLQLEREAKFQETMLSAQKALDDRDALLKQERDALTEQKERLSALEKQLSDVEAAKKEKDAQLQLHKEREIEAAKQNTQNVLAELQQKMKAYTNSPDGVVVEPPKSDDPISIQKHVSSLAQNAIKTMDQMQKIAEQSNMQASNAKRSRDEALGAIAPFGVPNAMPTMGTVNASAADEPAPKMHKVTGDKGEQLRSWMDSNKNALWTDIQRQFNMLSGSSVGGVVNASANGVWTRESMQVAEDQPKLNAMHLQPNLFKEMCGLVTGKIPDANEIQRLCATVHRQSAGPMR
jgi:hypothetical protein